MADAILYDEFIKRKRADDVVTGFHPRDLGSHLFDFQFAIVEWACKRGRAAIFADTGLGGRKPGAAVIEGRTVNTKQDWIVSFDIPNDHRKKGMPFILDDGAWKKVRSAKPAGEAETWCIRVDEDESFTAEGCVVKNCPMQFDLADRVIEQFSEKNDVVFDPFGGLMTVPYRAVLKGRYGMATELSASYFADGCGYLAAAEREMSIPSLFDFMDIEHDVNSEVDELEAA